MSEIVMVLLLQRTAFVCNDQEDLVHEKEGFLGGSRHTGLTEG